MGNLPSGWNRSAMSSTAGALTLLTFDTRRKVVRTCNRIIVLILAAVLLTACSPASRSTPPLRATVTPALASSPAAVSPALTALPVAPISALPTTAPTAVLPTEISPERSNSLKIRITVEDTEMTATLIDSNTTQGFMALLPLTLTLEDYGSTEKISYLPKRLSTEDAPAGIDPSVGDLTYYAPWGNLAIFIRDFGYSSGLVLLGKIDGNIAALNVSGPVSVTIELIE
jgi:hypothetical protein